jgi:hypothetical protein
VILVDFFKFVMLAFVLVVACVTMVDELLGHDKGSVAHYWAPYMLVFGILAGVSTWGVVQIERAPRPNGWATVALGLAQVAVWLVAAASWFMLVIIVPAVAFGGGVSM